MNKMKECKVIVPIGCRSDEGLSKPIIRRLNTSSMFKCYPVNLVPANFIESYNIMSHMITTSEPDLIFLTGDRIEMYASACAGFHANVKMAHYGAGILNYPIITFDDIDRHCITLKSNIHLCTCREEARTVQKLFNSLKIGMKANIHTVGITHLDDLEISEELVPEEPYDLILLNPETINNTITKNTIQNLLPNNLENVITIGPNPDGDVPILFGIDSSSKYYPNLPRAQFLGLLKNCKRFITNSSSAYYEAPFFLKKEQIILVGMRNLNRSKGQFKRNGSDRILKVLQDWWEKQN